MVETLRELNEQAIKDGYLLPDDQSYRKDLSQLLGKPLSYREQRAYLTILRHSEPITAEELAREIYPDYFRVDQEYCAIENTWNLISTHLKKKLGETAIISRGHSCYLSRRSLITSDVEQNLKKSVPTRS